MAPPYSSNYCSYKYTKNKNEMTIALNQRSVWEDEWGSKSSFNDIGTLNRKLTNNVDGAEVTEEWRNLTKKWDSELELFVIDVAGGQNSTSKIYWQEAQETFVSEIGFGGLVVAAADGGDYGIGFLTIGGIIGHLGK